MIRLWRTPTILLPYPASANVKLQSPSCIYISPNATICVIDDKRKYFTTAIILPMTITLSTTDPELFDLLQKEEARQDKDSAVIPSENFVSESVREAVGSVLMNKYSEGYPHKRYYQGNQHIDQIESLAQTRALSLFKLDPSAWHVNVQAVTGSIANLAVLTGLLELGDPILSMSLYDGGHLSHGWRLPEGKPISLTSRLFDSHFYHVDPKTHLFDYDEIAKLALKLKPKLIISGGTAYPREINHQKLREVADSVGAYYLADIAHEAGLVAAGVNSSPFPHAHVVTMTTRKTLRGPIGALIFSQAELAKKIDFAVFPGLQGGPQNHSIAGIGVALHEASKPEFKEYSKQVIDNAVALAAELDKLGFDLVSGGTDKHLVLIDLRNKGISGKDAALQLEKVGIIANKNTVPGETSKPWNPSGLRLGTPAMTTKGWKEADFKKLAQKISAVLTS